MAQLMLHREVLKNFGKLPAKVQKKIYELTHKFEEDSTQAGIHLEHLSPMAKDPKVRSARVGDDYRAIVIAPETGDVFLLMHVDHHNEAYAWCKNKLFEAHVATGSLQVFDVEETTAIANQLAAPPNQEVVQYPLDDLTDQELFQAGVPDALIPAVRAVRNDEAFDQLADYLPKEAAQVLTGIVAGMTLDESLMEMLGGVDDVAKPSGPGDFSFLSQAANMDLVLVEGEEHLQEILSEDIEEWRVFLHPYQKKLVEMKTKGPMKINGAAGTGKTVALMHRAVHLARQLPSGNEKVLVTTFTTNLSVTLKALIEKLDPVACQRIEVTNLHQLARTICHRIGWKGKIVEDSDMSVIWSSVLASGIPEGFERSFVVSEFEEIVDPMGLTTEEEYLTVVRSGRSRISRKQRKSLWNAFVQVKRELTRRNLMTFEGLVHQARMAVQQGNFGGFRHVLVDELQDFSMESLKLIAALSPIEKGLPDPLCVAGDGHQRIYNRTPIALGRAGIEVRGRSRRLKINYRTTEEIRQWAQAILVGIEIDDLDGEQASTQGDLSVMSGAEPRVVEAASEQEMAMALIPWINGLLDSGLKTHEICITPIKKEIVGELENAGIPTKELKTREMDPGREEAGVRYGSRQRIKGLEFKAVALLINKTEEDDPLVPYLNYVASTRAREHLLVVRRI